MKWTAAIIYVNLKGNLGDFAILHAMLADIQRTFPDCVPDVYSQPFVTVDERRLKAFMRTAPPFEYKGTMREDPHLITPLQVRALRMFSALRPYQEWRTAQLAKKAALDFGPQFAKYNAVYLAGGAQWTGVNAGVSMFGNLRAVAQHNSNIYTYPISISSSLTSFNLRTSLVSDFRKIRKPLIARDSQTYTLLLGLGLEATLGADCVFSLSSQFSGREEASRSSNRILFILTNQSSVNIQQALLVAKAAGYRATLLSTCVEEDGPSQRPAAENAGVPFIAPLTWQDVVTEMQASSVVVTNRLHGLILSSFSSASVIPLTDRQKVRAVVQDAELPIRVHALSELSEATISAAIECSEQISAKLKHYGQRALSLPWSPMGRVTIHG